MDIHKPKPWHGGPEFLKEIGTIVIGVLIALGAEQGVEWLHWRYLAAQAEADLNAGLQRDLIRASEWYALEPCHESRVAELSRALTAAGPQWRAAPQFPLT